MRPEQVKLPQSSQLKYGVWWVLGGVALSLSELDRIGGLCLCPYGAWLFPFLCSPSMDRSLKLRLTQRDRVNKG